MHQRFGPSGELGARAEAEVENFPPLVLRTLLHEAGTPSQRKNCEKPQKNNSGGLKRRHMAWILTELVLIPKPSSAFSPIQNKKK